MRHTWHHQTLPSLELIIFWLHDCKGGRFQLQIPTFEVKGLPSHTVDGRNPPPVHMKYILFFNKQVVQEFFHQQYYFHHQFATISLACPQFSGFGFSTTGAEAAGLWQSKMISGVEGYAAILVQIAMRKDRGPMEFRGPSWPDSRLIQMYTMKQSSVGLGKAHLTCKKP